LHIASQRILAADKRDALICRGGRVSCIRQLLLFSTVAAFIF